MKKLYATALLTLAFLTTSLFAQPRATYNGERGGINAATTAVGVGVVLGLGVIAVIVNNNTNNTSSHAHS